MGSTTGSGSAGHGSELLSPSEEFPGWAELPSPAPGGESSGGESQTSEKFLLWVFKLKVWESGLLIGTLGLLRAPPDPETCDEAVNVLAVLGEKIEITNL